MENYEVHCDEIIKEPRIFRFTFASEAMAEAERLCKTHKVPVRVVRVIGTFVPESRWISNGVPGYQLVFDCEVKNGK